VASAVDGVAVVIGHLPAGLEPGRLGQFPIPAVKRIPNISCLVRSRYATNERVPEPGSKVRNAPDRRLSLASTTVGRQDDGTQIVRVLGGDSIPLVAGRVWQRLWPRVIHRRRVRG